MAVHKRFLSSPSGMCLSIPEHLQGQTHLSVMCTKPCHMPGNKVHQAIAMLSGKVMPPMAF